MGPLSNPVPSSYTNAYEPDEPSRRSGFGDDGTFHEDPPVMRRADGSAIAAAVAEKAITQRKAPVRSPVAKRVASQRVKR
jgi:hypothetical protein